MTVTPLHQITASAVPSIPKEVSALQRLEMLNLASDIREYLGLPSMQRTMATVLLERAEKMLREVST